MNINVYSEIGKLKQVLLHRPGKELENLTPNILEKLLFDDIPYLKIAQEEHDAFATVLKNAGAQVLYVADVVSEIFTYRQDIKEAFIVQFIEEAQVKSKSVKSALYDYLISLPYRRMVEKMIEGIRTHDIVIHKPTSIMDLLGDEYPFYTDPMPNLLFQRDPFASIGKGIAINKMYTETRHRETIFAEYIFKHHPQFNSSNTQKYYDRTHRYHIEGGDILVLNRSTLAVGISKRTDPRAIEHLAEALFSSSESFKTVLAINIPKTRAFMHLDTVLTQADYGIFTVHPGIKNIVNIFEITKKDDQIDVKETDKPLEDVLEKHLKTPVELIYCGGSDIVHSEREQWNDGANTLAVEPGKVIAYSRNHITNDILRNKGIEVIEIPSSELSRGRGGPRCMSMPIFREDI